MRLMVTSNRISIQMLTMILMLRTMLKITLKPNRPMARLKMRTRTRVTNMMTILIKKTSREVSSKRLMTSAVMMTNSTKKYMTKTGRMTITPKKRSKEI